MTTKDGAVYLCRIPLQDPSRTDDHAHAICGDITHAHGSAPCTRYGDRQGEDGPMVAAVRADLAGVDIGATPGGRTYQAMAFWLAGVIDKRGEDDGPSTTAKLAVELSKVMASLTKTSGGSGDGPSDFEKWTAGNSIPS